MTADGGRTAVQVDPVRRYALLSFLQWLPVGLMMVPMVLLLLERGFTLAEIALVGAASSVTVAVLELPTGSLADLVGRRPVLVASAVAHAVALVVLGLAGSLALLLVSAGLRGLARALSTGPLEAWYVDLAQASRTTDGETAHLTAGLARGEMASSVALGLGTLVGGAIPVLVRDVALPVPALAVPVLLAAVVEIVRVGFTVGLPDAPRARGTVLEAFRAVPRTVGSGLRLAGRERIVARLLLVSGTTGVALAVLELVTPAWLEAVTADPGRAALVYAVLVTVGFGADAFGAMLAPAVRRRLARPAAASAIATAVALVAAIVLSAGSLAAGTTGLVLTGVAYLGLFVGLGAAGPPLNEVLHGRVGGEERATMLSVQSLMLQLAGAGGGLLAGYLTIRLGGWSGFAVAAVALGFAVHLLVTMPSDGAHRRRTPRLARQPVPVGTDGPES